SAPRTGRDLRGRPEPRHQQPLRARPPHPRAGLVDVLPELLAQPAHRRARDDLITAAAGDDPHSPRQQPSFADLTARRRTLSILPRRLTRLSCCPRSSRSGLPLATLLEAQLASGPLRRAGASHRGCFLERRSTCSFASRRWLVSRAGIVLLCTLTVAAASEAQQAPGNAVRPRLDLTRMVRLTRTVPLAAVTPAMAENIGPGSHLIIDIPGAGTFGCTANFIWASGATRYLGAAGHCFIPEGTTATHGPCADFNASGVRVSVCVSNCSFGGESGFTLTGALVVLGAVAYARQTAADGDIGNDFG